MDYDAGEFRIEQNNYYIPEKSKIKFDSELTITNVDKKTCFDFAFDMTYGGKGKQRNYRSGGSIHRTKGQAFINTFQGKMAEFAVYRYLQSNNIKTSRPDTKKMGKGKWDCYDIKCKIHNEDKMISVKSTKEYGQLLLLETKDWDQNGQYRHNKKTKGATKYDYTVLVRFSPNGEDLMKEKKILYLKNDSIPDNIKEILVETILSKEWKYDLPGFIYYSEMVKMIRDNKIIPKNAQINGSKKMDADNYFFQVGNMHKMSEILNK
jgi:hypothetical protein